jgi:hypothetical protein
LIINWEDTMAEKTAYEQEARELKPLKGPDPHDAFSQKAAENKKPPLGIGLTEKVHERSETHKSDLTDSSAGVPEAEAAAQFKGSRADRSNSGMSSGNPRALSGDDDGDASFPVKHEE